MESMYNSYHKDMKVMKQVEEMEGEAIVESR